MESYIKPIIHDSWRQKLLNEFDCEYFKNLKEFLVEEKRNYKVYPKGEDIFNAFNLTTFDTVKVVLIGQDPYHGDGQAHGLSFSVPKGIKPPPSLVNIFKELKSDVDFKIPDNGNLEKWAKQGVLLLNATLTVRAHQAGSHQKIGWEQFTDAVIKLLSREKTGVIFLLWGRFAQNKSLFIDENKHYILKAAHPSPFSAYNGFFGCKHFSTTNEILLKQGKSIIDWQIE